jgi:glycosyltransferase involved in cell wall biosynthesis
LRILHLSHETLPDWRIEKSALTASNMGHEVIFAGRPPNLYDREIFSKIYEIGWDAKARLGLPFYWHSVKKQFDKILKETKPDIIHAHNIFSAKMVSEFGLPFVYDDHEYWSKLSILLNEMVNRTSQRNDKPRELLNSEISLYYLIKIRRILINNYAIRLWTKWEREIVSSHPTITVSDQIATELRANYNTNRVFVVPNFPMKSEVKDLGKPEFHNRLSCVYAGGDGHNIDKYPNRNIDDLDKTFIEHDISDLTIIGWSNKSSGKIKYMGFLPRQYMYKEMFNHSIGLIPFKRHWSHVYISPNKAYEYAHAGLFVMCRSSLKVVIETLKEHCATFEDYDDMASKLLYFKENLDELYSRRLRTYNYAQDNLIWDKNEKNIITAYKMS